MCCGAGLGKIQRKGTFFGVQGSGVVFLGWFAFGVVVARVWTFSCPGGSGVGVNGWYSVGGSGGAGLVCPTTHAGGFWNSGKVKKI